MRQKPEWKPSTNSIARVSAVVSTIPLKGLRENLQVAVMPRPDRRGSFASQDYWLVAPATTGVDRAGGGLIPPFPGNSGAGDGVTVTEPGVMTVRP